MAVADLLILSPARVHFMVALATAKSSVSFKEKHLRFQRVDRQRFLAGQIAQMYH